MIGPNDSIHETSVEDYSNGSNSIFKLICFYLEHKIQSWTANVVLHFWLCCVKIKNDSVWEYKMYFLPYFGWYKPWPKVQDIKHQSCHE